MRGFQPELCATFANSAADARSRLSGSNIGTSQSAPRYSRQVLDFRQTLRQLPLPDQDMHFDARNRVKRVTPTIILPWFFSPERAKNAIFPWLYSIPHKKCIDGIRLAQLQRRLVSNVERESLILCCRQSVLPRTPANRQTFILPPRRHRPQVITRGPLRKSN